MLIYVPNYLSHLWSRISGHVFDLFGSVKQQSWTPLFEFYPRGPSLKATSLFPIGKKAALQKECKSSIFAMPLLLYYLPLLDNIHRNAVCLLIFQYIPGSQELSFHPCPGHKKKFMIPGSSIPKKQLHTVVPYVKSHPLLNTLSISHKQSKSFIFY